MHNRVAFSISESGHTLLAHAPPGHGIGLAPAVEQDQPVADRFVAEQADMLAAVVEHPAVDLIAHHEDLRVILQALDQPVELLARHRAAGRVGRGC